jgi:hypothetical protein
MTRTEFLALLNAYSVKCATAGVLISGGTRRSSELNDELIRMWQQISAAVVEHWHELTPAAPPHWRGHCPTCGPTELEDHPRISGVVRCSNCKEHLPRPL